MTRSQSRKVKLAKQKAAMASKGFVKVGRTWVKSESPRHLAHIKAKEKRAMRFRFA